MSNALATRTANTITVNPSALLDDNKTFQNRFQIKSSSSASLYLIAQSKSGRWWACSCKGYVYGKKDSPGGKTCKHLTSLGLAERGQSYLPVEVQLQVEGASKPALRVLEEETPVAKPRTAKKAPKAAAPVALSNGITVAGVEMVNGKVVVTFEGDQAAIFAALATITK